MSLINCKECGKEISDKAENCPHCGFPMNEIVKFDNEVINIDNEIKELQNEELTDKNDVIKDSVNKEIKSLTTGNSTTVFYVQKCKDNKTKICELVNRAKKGTR